MNKIKISAVSYTNTKPFIYGLQHSEIMDSIDLSLDTPTDCAQKLIDGTVDIGLIPVAAVLKMPYWELVTDYCIGANGPVNSVFIFGNCPVEQMKFLQLDPQSRSSNNLAKVLLKNHWEATPELIENATDYTTSEDRFTGFVQIGDRTFGKRGTYPYTYDLAEEWKKLTGLPFMFAGWIANKPIEKEFIGKFNKALKYGLEHRTELFDELTPVKNFDIEDYLTTKIVYNLDENKRKAMQLFLEYIRQF